MTRTTISPNISDILQLLENFPINNKLETEIDAKVSIENKKDVIERLGINDKAITFRDIVNLLTNFIKGIYSTDAKINTVRLSELRSGLHIPCSISIIRLLFGCLEGDHLDAKYSWNMLSKLLV